MNHQFKNSNPEGWDSNCSVCGGKKRDSIHHDAPAITNCRKNIMGTVSFDGKFTGMRKAQDFIVYPMQDSGEVITIQSDHRFGRLDLGSGWGVLSANRAQYANSVWLALCVRAGTAIDIDLAFEDAQTLRQWIKSTGGLEVGSSIVKCDNMGALAL